LFRDRLRQVQAAASAPPPWAGILQLLRGGRILRVTSGKECDVAGEFDRAARQGFGFALGAIIAIVIVVCAAILLLVLFSLAV
jgi:hypothetical protein